MTLDQIVLNNFGPFLGEQTICFRNVRSERPVVLIGALNGSGKTTLLDALQLVLYGRLAETSNRGTGSYESYLRRSIHRAADPSAGASVELRFRHAVEGVERLYTVRRSWSVRGPAAREHLEVSRDGVPDRALTDAWEAHVEAFVPRRIAPLFFFDGEKIEALADPRRSSELLSTAIHSLLGVDLVEQLLSDLIVLERRNRPPRESRAEMKQVEEAEAELAWVEERYASLAQERASAQNELDRAKKHLREVEDRFRREGGDLFEDRRRLGAERKSVEALLAKAEADLSDIAAGVAPLFLVMDILRRIAEQDERERAAEEAEVLAHTLVERDALILRELRSVANGQQLVSAIERFLEVDRESRTVARDTERYLLLSRDAHSHLRHLLNEDLSDDVRGLIAEALRQARDLKARLEDLDRGLAQVPPEDAVAEVLRERQTALVRHDHAQARLEALDQELRKLVTEREIKRQRVTAALERVVELNFEREGAERVITHAQRARVTLERFRARVVEHHIGRLEGHVLSSLRMLLRKESLVHTLTIDPRTFTLVLQGSNGQEIPPDRLSAGERQLLAVSLLWGLARASGRKLPIVIDTPLGRLDTTHRRHMVERYFRHAGHQVLLLSTDDEIDERHYEMLRSHIGVAFRLVHDDEAQATRVEPGYFWS